MKSEIRRSLSGPFSTRQMATGIWQVTSRGPVASEIALRVATAGASDALQDASLTMLELDWHDAGVTVTLTVDRGVTRLEATTAIVHEPQPKLYESLALAAFDVDARRFWRRVFTLMRIPGGGFLLRYMARRKRARVEPRPQP